MAVAGLVILLLTNVPNALGQGRWAPAKQIWNPTAPKPVYPKCYKRRSPCRGSSFTS